MAKDIFKTGYRELQDHLIAISEIPERLNRCDIVLKRELLEHIEIRIKELLKIINGQLMVCMDENYPSNYLPNRKFEYWAENTFVVFNYYELLILKEHILKSIEPAKKHEVTPYPFNEFIYYENFLTYLERNHIIDLHPDYSYLFQRLKDLKYIQPITHKNFMKWLLDQNHISEIQYNILFEIGGFTSFAKSTSTVRENNFNTVFQL